MKAFVKVKNGHFPTVDYYLAWHGLDELGYEVIKFEEQEIDNLEITAETPVIADVQTSRSVIKRFFGWDYNGIDPYPVALRTFLMREVVRTKWHKVKTAVMGGRMKNFVKPVIEKQFTGGVATSIRHAIRRSKIQDADEVYVSNPVSFAAEFRVYVHDDEIVGIKHYNGSWYMHPIQETVENMVERYRPGAPVAYGLDVGTILVKGEWRTALVEVNDAICLGNYGLDGKPYAQMVADRWQELVENGKA